MWCLYIFIGASVSLLITGVLALTGLILDLRVDATKILLDDGNIGLAWLSWTGSSLILCLFAVAMVLIEPAAASSGIPGLIAFLNGVEPHGKKYCSSITVSCFHFMKTYLCHSFFNSKTKKVAHHL